MYKAEFNVASCLLDPLETSSQRERRGTTLVDELQQNSPCFILNYAAMAGRKEAVTFLMRLLVFHSFFRHMIDSILTRLDHDLCQ